MDHIVVAICLSAVLLSSGVLRPLFQWGTRRNRNTGLGHPQPSESSEQRSSVPVVGAASVAPPPMNVARRDGLVWRGMRGIGRILPRLLRRGTRRRPAPGLDDLEALASRVSQLESALRDASPDAALAPAVAQRFRRVAPEDEHRGLDAAQIAHKSGISRAEVELMLRMRGIEP